MTISPFKPGALTRGSADFFVSLRRDMAELQRQLVTGQKADSYGGLGFERRTSLDARARLSALDTFSDIIGQADLRIRMMTQNLEHLAKLSADTKSDLALTKFEQLSDGRTFAQKTADQRLREAIDLLNADFAGRSLFAGRSVDVSPVESYERIMDGDGAGNAGLKTVLDERIRAERGVNGLGRLDVTRAGTVVTVAQEGAALPFGFKLTAVATTGGAITHTESAAPTPNSQIAVGALPNDGDTLTLTLTDPAGAEHTIRLTARATLVAGERTGFKVGADATETAENLRSVLVSSIKEAVDAKLLPAAAMETTAQFFETPPTLQRVSGVPSFEAATAWSADPDPHVVSWYKGDAADPADARGTAPVRIDQSQVVATGAQAERGGHQECPRAARGHECRLVQARRRRLLCGSDGPGLRETGGQAGKSAGERGRHGTRERVDRNEGDEGPPRRHQEHASRCGRRRRARQQGGGGRCHSRAADAPAGELPDDCDPLAIVAGALFVAVSTARA